MSLSRGQSQSDLIALFAWKGEMDGFLKNVVRCASLGWHWRMMMMFMILMFADRVVMFGIYIKDP